MKKLLNTLLLIVLQSALIYFVGAIITQNYNIFEWSNFAVITYFIIVTIYGIKITLKHLEL